MRTLFKREQFFQLLKESLGPDVNLAEWLGDVLDIGSTASYRRINGESVLSLEETLQILHAAPEAAMLSFELFTEINMRMVQLNSFSDEEGFYRYLINIQKLFDQLKLSPVGHIYYVARDIPIFHFLDDADVLTYKYRYWAGRLDKPMSTRLAPHIIIAAREISEAYQSIASTELWFTQCVHNQYEQLKHEEKFMRITPIEHTKIRETLGLRMQHLVEWVREGAKPKGGKLNLYTRPYLSLNNSALFEWDDDAFLTGSIWNAHHIVSYGKRDTQQYKVSFLQDLRTARQITDRSEREVKGLEDVLGVREF